MNNNYGCFIVPLGVIHLIVMALANIGKNVEMFLRLDFHCAVGG